MAATTAIRVPVKPPSFRAGSFPGPVCTSVSRETMCPDALAGCCRPRGVCSKGIHDLSLVSEVEEEAAACPVTASRRVNCLQPSYRRMGMDGHDQNYHRDGPGTASSEGPRHDNDFRRVEEIRLLPTTDEILSCRLPHLPLKDEAIERRQQDNNDSLRQYCAMQFRHLRFECTEPVIDAMYLSLQRLVVGRHQRHPTDYQFRQKTEKGVSFNLFYGVKYEDLSFHEFDGLQARFSFNCPTALRRDAMRQSNVLQSGMLCCLLAVNTQTDELYTVFLEIVTRHSTWGMRHKTADDSRAALITKLADTGNTAKAKELVWLLKLAPEHMKFALADMSGVLVTGFIHHLRRLQSLCGDNGDSVPFTDYLTAYDESGSEMLDVRPPEYSRHDDFAWKLDGLKHDENDKEPFRVNKTLCREEVLDRLQARTTLDIGQANALFDNLTREFAFTQGPPGTGKSFLGIATVKIFVDSVPRKQRGPVLVVAQTNHALDEILEGLQAKGIDAIARIGTRSKSVKLTPTFLKHLRDAKTESCQETTWRKDAERRCHNLERDGIAFCETMGEMDRILSRFRDWHVNHPDSGENDSESPRPSARYSDDSSDSEARPERSHPRAEGRRRQKETKGWAKTLDLEQQCDMLVEIHRRHGIARDALATARRLKNMNILETKDILGMTTSACAREYELLKQIKPRILVIEEASEVLEAHTICALSPSIQHCINIGDPLQLRPRVDNRVLELEHSANYRLNEPLFERIIKAGIPYAKLSVQRRAHPDLSCLIQATDYPFVVNHDSTAQRDPVRGMTSRLQWCNHKVGERFVSPKDDVLIQSWENPYEAAMAVHFATKFLKSHDYGPGDVAIITPYNGQLALITEMLAKRQVMINISKEDQQALITGGYMSRDDLGPLVGKPDLQVNISDLLRVGTLDNFQGEEAKIVILSTVRSNDSGKIGFLGVSNRINVAVSRAQEGFYVIGNADLLRKSSDHWAKVIGRFEKSGGLANGWRVTCRYHPDESILVNHPEAAVRAVEWVSFGCSRCESW